MEPRLAEVVDGTSSSGAALREEGAAFLRQGRFAEAAHSLGRAAAFDPNDVVAWRLLGGALASSGDHAAAVAAFENAVRLVPEDARNSCNLGVALAGMGRAREARSAFETSLKIDPAYQPARTQIEALNGGARLAGAADPTGIYQRSGPPGSEAPDFGSAPLSSAGAAPVDDRRIPQFPARPPAPVGAGGAMPGLAALGASSAGTDFARPLVAPSPATPILRQPGASAAYNPSAAFGSTQSRFVPDPVLGLPSETFQNTSGTIGEVPDEVARGFNLGAAMFAFWWLRSHNLKPLAWWLLGAYVVVRCVSRYFEHYPVVPIALGLIDIAMFLVFGFAGNRVGWQNRRFDDIRDFKACQRIWMFWAVPFVVCEVILIAVLLLIVATRIF